LAELQTAEVPFGSRSGRRPEIDASLEALGLGSETVVVERGDVERAKPEPDLFLACAAQLDVSPEECYAVWDLLASRRRGCSASAFSAAPTERTNWPAPALFAFTETRVSSGSR
jgi:beta-phosphoglucomutase-like phosphatase (HAD superfamily)